LPDSEASAILNCLLSAGHAAADLALSYAKKPLKNWMKANASPVTEADLAVDALLKERLTAMLPEAGWLSEETADNEARLACRDVLIVDPIDGTRAFMAGLPDWTISLALTRNGRPLAAVLVEPIAGRTFAAVLGKGATCNGVPLRLGPSLSLAGRNVAGPKPLAEAFITQGAKLVPKVHSLALRLTQVATGELAIGLASRHSHDWDIAASDLIVHEAGGLLSDFAGNAPVYNAPHPVHPPLLAAASDLHESARRLLQS
jgi:myo-inositol-1(or 4)-monophosphatase